MQKKATGFSMAYNNNVNSHINHSSLLCIVPPQLQNMTQRHQIMFGFKIFIQAGIYQELNDNWRKWRLRYIKNNKNSFTGE